MISKEMLAPSQILSVTIEDNASLSDASETIKPVGATIIAVDLPNAWIAAALSLQVSRDGGTSWSIPLDPATGAYFVTGSITPATDLGAYVPLDPVMMKGITNIKVQSGTNASAVNQTGGPLTITVVTSPVF